MADERSAAGGASGPRLHDLGPAGIVEVWVDTNDVRIRGVDGTEARVVSPADGAGVETRAEPGRFSIRTARHVGVEKSGFVGLRVGSRGFGVPFTFKVGGTLEVEVPRDAAVTVTATAGDIAVRDVHGGTSVKTAAGDISIKRVAGAVVADAASGDVNVAAVAPVTLDIRSISGDVRARGPQLDRVAIETVSGDVELHGRFAPGPLHGITSVSGDVELAVVGGLSVQARTVSGDVSCEHPDRRSGDGRRQPIVIGDGAAQVAVRTMSGDVEVRAAKAAGREPGAGRHDAFGAGFGVDTPRPPASPAPPARPGGPPGLPGIPPIPPIPPIGRPAQGPAPASLEETQPAPPAAPVTSGADVPTAEQTLAILEAVARGEIEVAEAERRLAGTRAVSNEEADHG